MMYAADYQDNFYWVSAAEAVHSRNIELNPRIALVVFDSIPEYGKAQALYCKARAGSLTGDALSAGCETFYKMRYPDPAQRKEKGRGPEDFSGDSPRRMYRATIEEYSVLHPDKHPIYGTLIDHRVVIPFSTALLDNAR
jgi:hypothetical protein